MDKFLVRRDYKGSLQENISQQLDREKNAVEDSAATSTGPGIMQATNSDFSLDDSEPETTTDINSDQSIKESGGLLSSQDHRDAEYLVLEIERDRYAIQSPLPADGLLNSQDHRDAELLVLEVEGERYQLEPSQRCCTNKQIDNIPE